MLSKIIEAEQTLDALLPSKRLMQSPPANLMAAAKAWTNAVWAEAEQSGPMPLTDKMLSDGHRLSANPVFIFGVHRSGTTLVRNILDGHPELVVLPSEGTYYTNLGYKLNALPENERLAFLGKEWLRRLANPVNQPPYWLLERSTATSSAYIDFARYLMAWWQVLKQKENTQWPHMAIVLAYAACTNNTAAKFWVDKTPANERYIKRIWREMPSAQIIHVVRNPVNILSSRKKMEPGVNLRSALSDMKMSFCVATKYLHDPRFMVVRYEELCDQPQIITGQLASFLNIRVSAILGKATVGGTPAHPNSSFNHEGGSSGQILRPPQHSQHHLLNKVEHQLLNAYISNAAARLNYHLAKPGFFNKYYLIIRYWFLFIVIDKH